MPVRQLRFANLLRSHMRKTMIAHNKPTFGVDEQRVAASIIKSGWVAQGLEVENFEREFCSYLGLPAGHAVALSSGTAALYLALRVLGVRDRGVDVPAYACSSLRHAVAMAGGREILSDTAENSPNADTNELNASDSDFSIIAHMYGLPLNIRGLKKHVIEDCAQALGASVNNIKVGLKGDIGIYSFYATKLITSGGQGGMLVSRYKKYTDAARDFREFDCRKNFKPRFNLQMTDLQAAIGRVQLKRLPGFLDRREQIYNKYKSAGLNLLDIPSSSGNLSPVRFRAVMRVANPEKCIATLKRAGVDAIVPILDWELPGRGRRFPRALMLSRSTVSLPVYPSLSDTEVNRIIKAL